MEKNRCVIRMAEFTRASDSARMILMQSPYDRDFVETFKTLLPSEDRSWDASRKLWSFRAEHHDAVVELVESNFPNGEIDWADDPDELGAE